MTPVPETRDRVSLYARAAEHDREGEDGHRVDEVVGQERMDEFGATQGEKNRAVFVPQALYVGDVAHEHRALPARVDPARARNHVLLDLLEELRDAAVGSVIPRLGTANTPRKSRRSCGRPGDRVSH